MSPVTVISRPNFRWLLQPEDGMPASGLRRGSRTAGWIVIACLAVPTATIGARFPFDPAPVLTHDPKLAAAGNYRLERAHSSVTVRLSHMGLSFYTMRLDDFSGSYSYDPRHPAGSKISIALDPASIDTGNPHFDAMIAADYLEAGKYPSISFVSTAIRARGDHGTVSGVLTMHGVSKPIILHVVYHGYFGDEKPERMGFSASTTFKRSDFGVDPNVPAEGDDAMISIEAEFRHE
jgi:polyisoprenoid-binding protein YceI